MLARTPVLLTSDAGQGGEGGITLKSGGVYPQKWRGLPSIHVVFDCMCVYLRIIHVFHSVFAYIALYRLLDSTAGGLAKLFALHEVISETESRARLVKNEACDPKHLGDFRPALAIVRW